MTIVHVGIDLAKNVFARHGVNARRQINLRRLSVARAKLHATVAALPPCTTALETCTGEHHRARLFIQSGHTVKLVARYRVSGKRGKNEASDAAAICEAAQRRRARPYPAPVGNV